MPPVVPDFDYIVVGAGSTGCVLVNRLSADPTVRVLLLEAGESGEADPAVTAPGRWTALMGSPYDWGYRTEAEPALEQRRIDCPRGRAHGGSSAINAMAHIRGDRRCFDAWAAQGNAGWSYGDLLPLFKRSERSVVGDDRYRGRTGPLAVMPCLDPHAGHEAFLDAAAGCGFPADREFDFNGPAPEGTAGFYEKNILEGRRHSTAAAFLVPVLARPNLEIISSAQAARLVVEGRGERQRVGGVEYLRRGQLAVARASREVLLCAGAVDSPKLLLLSGIGPADELRAHAIPVVADLPGVGRNLQDHPKLSIRWQGRTTLPGSTVTAGLFARSPHNPASAPPDLQFYVGRGIEAPDQFTTISLSVVRPRSRGTVSLRSPDPLTAPIVRANYLQDPLDLKTLLEGAGLARAIGESTAYDHLRGEAVAPGPDAISAADLERFARSTLGTFFHPAGTCRMGPVSDRTSVVDAMLRVHGLDGLRVADASIMPEIVNAPTHAACVMIGERCAQLVARA